MADYDDMMGDDGGLGAEAGRLGGAPEVPPGNPVGLDVNR